MAKLTNEILDSLNESEPTSDQNQEADTATESSAPAAKTEDKAPSDTVGGTSTTSSTEGEGDEAKSTSETTPVEKKSEDKPKSPSPPLSKHRVKVDGEEFEVDEPELVRGYQLARASHKRLQEAATAKKEAEGLFDVFDKDPFDALQRRLERKNNWDPDRADEEVYKTVLKWIEPRVLERQMEEKDRQTSIERRRIDRDRQRLKEEAQTVESAKRERAERESTERSEKELYAAIDSHKIPKEPIVRQALGNFLRRNYLAPGIEFTFDDAVGHFASYWGELERERKVLEGSRTTATTSTSPQNGSASPTTPKPFPSTKTGEESPAKERERKPTAHFSNARDFHRAILAELT